MLTLPPPLAPLAARVQFVTWVAVPHADKPGKFNKFPTDWRTGHVASAHDPAIWTTPDVALAMAPGQDRGHGSGIGFVFTAADPYFFLDMDSCLLPDGTWSPLAQELCARLTGAAAEVSMSGRGLHIIGRYSRDMAHACKNTPYGLELYTDARFVALTGTSALGDADTDCTDALAAIIAQYFPPSATGDFEGWTSAPVPEWAGPTNDDELVRRMLASGSKSAAAVFGGKVTAADLWRGNADVLCATWPHDHKPYDASHADMALANHLAFWTGKDCERMERLMRASALVRDKWDTHRTYLADTILKACAYVGKVATGPAPRDPVVAPSPPEAMEAATAAARRQMRPEGGEYMPALHQVDHFQGCYFITRGARIYSLRHNEVYKRPEFDVVFGGHLFVIDPEGSKTTASAWEAFTVNRVITPLTVVDMCFRPELPPGALAYDGMLPLVNTYVPHAPREVDGDITPFVDFLRRLLPNDNDRAILVNYMASLVQNPGVKFQWWPVLQGVKGNGKTLILSALTYAVGEQYTHLPNALALARDGIKFNAWLHRKLFIGIEEVKVAGKWDFLEELKAIVTNRRIGIEGKGVEAETRDNRANGLLITNHPDGVPITDDERRYAVLYTAQQHKSDLARDGMDGDYFPILYRWFHTDGAAIICRWLRTFPIEASLDPAGMMHRAPQTSSTAAAIENSLGRVEQEILDAIEEGRPGFAGGWVSSRYMDDLIDRMRAGVPRSRRRALMQALGYDWHPNLVAGRVNDVVSPDMAKPKLFVSATNPARHLTRATDIAAAYSAAQAPGAKTPPLVVASGGV